MRQLFLVLCLWPLIYNLSAYSATPLLIENNSQYNLRIYFTLIGDDDIHEIPILANEGVKKIGFLTQLDNISFARDGILSASYSLTSLLDRLKKGIATHANQEAVIEIIPTLTSWQTKGRFEKNKKVLSDSEITWELVSLNEITEGLLGEDIKEKANKILNANYSEAQKLGFVNLAHHLEREFSDKLFQEVPLKIPRTVRKKLLMTALKEYIVPSYLTYQEARALIERVYRTFLSYKKKKYI